MSRISVAPINASEHAAFVAGQPSASFLQTPGWALVKPEWTSESLGWFLGNELVGAGLVLYRRLPKIRRSLAYLPEGPVLEWADDRLPAYLDALVDHVRSRGAFGVRMGPPLITRRWAASTVKAAIAGGECARLGQLPADVTEPLGAEVTARLRALGWRAPRDTAGFAAGQPRYVFQVPLAGRSDDELLKAMNQLWRRNIKKAAKAGVEVSQVKPDELGSALPAFHQLYVETARRDGFRPRPLSYFATMFKGLAESPASEIRLYNATHQGDLVASTVWIRVGRHAWYSYGASSSANREVRGSNAIQWQMIKDAAAAGAMVYDLRGITDTLDPDDPHFGLVQFKLGTGGEVVEYAGEWDLAINPILYTVFDLYLRLR